MRIAIALLAALAAAAPSVWPQVGLESTTGSAYPAEWPAGPRADSLPEWAKPGRIRFARWDGGRIETAKAMLSGWPGFNPPDPNRLETMTNWYRPETVRFLREAGINMIWVTFSNGFSIETERPHQQQVRRYIEECHRQGIHVMAYESIANMFWEDMYEKVPESRRWGFIGMDGKPVPYGAGDYSKMGRVTRYMADLRNPEWRAYLRRRIDLALDAGADGVIYDNNFSNNLLETYQEMYRYGASRKKDFLLMGNFHANTYVFNRLINAITTEDGVEPGVYADGRLVNNIGLFRVHQALSEGWKPAMIEDGRRESGVRETTPMSAGRHKLALAEAMMFGISMELFVEGAFAHGLATGNPETRRIWQAIGQYNRFFADNEEYYTDNKSMASLAIVLDDRSEQVALLNSLAARNVLYDVLYEHDVTGEKLANYGAVAVLAPRTVRARAQAALDGFVSRGGKVLSSPDLEAVARAVEPAVRVDAPRGVLYNAAEQESVERVLVHLLNYTGQPVGGIKVALRSRFSSVKLLSPDTPRAPVRVLSPTEVEVPALGTYSLLVFE